MTAEIITLNTTTFLDIPPERVLDSAKEVVTSVIVIGEDEKGEPYFASSMTSKGDMLLLLERFKQRLLADEES